MSTAGVESQARAGLASLARTWPHLLPVALVGVAAPLALPRPETTGVLYLIVGLVWSGYVLLALLGWGGLAARLLLPSGDAGWGLRAALGMALAVNAGGLLNLLGLISRGTVLGLLLVGAILALGGTAVDRATLRARLERCRTALRTDSLAMVLLGTVVVIAALQIAASVTGTINNVSTYRDFDLHDDCQGYLVFPHKMLQTGSMGPDPFETRRLAALGGQSFLQTLPLAALPERAIHVMDAGIALLILLGLTWGLARARGLPLRLTALLLLFVLAMPHLEARGNVTALLTGASLLLALVVLADGPLLAPERPGRNALAVGILIAAACALKVTFIPMVVLYFGIATVASVWRAPSRRAALAEALATVGVIFVLVSPWMIAMYRGFGTLLYPMLGKGYGSHVPLERLSEMVGFSLGVPPAGAATLLLRHALQALPVLVLALLVRERSHRMPVLALALTLVGTIPILDHFHDPYLERALYRYYFPLLLASLVAALAASFSAGRRRLLGGVRAGAAVGIAVLTLLRFDDLVAGQAVQVVKSVAEGVAGAPLGRPEEDQATDALQHAVPPGSTVLARLPFPSTLDFRRNQVWECSLPGLTSPPPGMPTFSGGEALGAYLADQGVQYLAYGGRDTPYRLLQLTTKDIKDRYQKSRTRWEMYLLSQDFHTSVRELEATHRVLHATEHEVVLDVGMHVLTLDRPPQGVTTAGIRPDGWTAGEASVAGLGWRLGTRTRLMAVRLHGWHPFQAEPARLHPRLESDGRELTLVGHEGRTILFELPPELRSLERVRILSAAFKPEEAGLAASDRAFGLDLEELRAGADVAALQAAIAPPPAPLSSLDPHDMAFRRGIYPDNNWTSGTAVLSGFRYEVPEGHRVLTLTVGTAHPSSQDVARLDVRVHVNGLPLACEGISGRTLRFRLGPGLRAIEHLEVTSSTFVPRELGIGNDTRTLGVPIQALATSP